MVLRSQPSAPPVLRVVLLGASNLKMGLPTVVERVRRAAGGPVEILAACGHGRSYVQWSRIVFNARALPGLAGCGLWRALDGRPPLPTVALAIDAGNDLLYGPSVEEIAAGFTGCLRRLSALGAGVVAMPLPMVSLEKVSTFRYHAARTILFPGRGEPWPSLLERARDLDRRLRRAAAEHGACLVEPQTAWYGIDPIHVRRRWRRQAWDHIRSHWRLRAPPGDPGALRLRAFRTPLFGSEELRLFGAPRRTPQPACRLADGSTVALY
jgi:hypothetical protein